MDATNMFKREEALKSAAYLVAAMSDPKHGAPRLSLEVSDSLEILAEELNALGLLDVYRQDDGSLAV
ncbi:hypothetical protein [Ralstonia pseudosolanacearum]|uniref:hypothetical protein n=1 Tax=Ralstonia pseudosolanacearum TaxID=1310165 RepID=UPI00201D6FF9|nr:hypothetical protein [Ralstonia pseudosolanacearum]UQY83675.1 hypothetical protein JNO62_06025 [Ralstonia pseudosolanacearum]